MPTEKIPPKREFDDERRGVIPSAEGLKARRERRKQERQARQAKRESQELGDVGVADTPGNISPEETIGSAENISASWQEVKGLLDKEPEELIAADKELARIFLERINNKQFADKFYEDMATAGWREEGLQDALEGLVELNLEQNINEPEEQPEKPSRQKEKVRSIQKVESLRAFNSYQFETVELKRGQKVYWLGVDNKVGEGEIEELEIRPSLFSQQDYWVKIGGNWRKAVDIFTNIKDAELIAENKKASAKEAPISSSTETQDNREKKPWFISEAGEIKFYEEAKKYVLDNLALVQSQHNGERELTAEAVIANRFSDGAKQMPIPWGRAVLRQMEKEGLIRKESGKYITAAEAKKESVTVEHSPALTKDQIESLLGDFKSGQKEESTVKPEFYFAVGQAALQRLRGRKGFLSFQTFQDVFTEELVTKQTQKAPARIIEGVWNRLIKEDFVKEEKEEGKSSGRFYVNRKDLKQEDHAEPSTEEEVVNKPEEEDTGWMPDISKITKQETIKPSESTEKKEEEQPKPTPETEQLPTLENIPPAEEKKKEIKKYNPKTLTPEEIEEGQKPKNDINKLTAQERSNLSTLDIEILSKKQERGIDDIRKDFAELKLRLSGIKTRKEAEELLSEILELSSECEKEPYNKSEEDSEKSGLEELKELIEDFRSKEFWPLFTKISIMEAIKLMETKKGGEAPAPTEGAEDEKTIDEVNKSEPSIDEQTERVGDEEPAETDLNKETLENINDLRVILNTAILKGNENKLQERLTDRAEEIAKLVSSENIENNQELKSLIEELLKVLSGESEEGEGAMNILSRQISEITGLSEAEVKEIYQTQEEVITREAESKVNKGKFWKGLASTAGYIGTAGLIGFASGGLGLVAAGTAKIGLVGLAGFRVAERSYRGKKYSQQVEEEIENIKGLIKGDESRKNSMLANFTGEMATRIQGMINKIGIREEEFAGDKVLMDDRDGMVDRYINNNQNFQNYNEKEKESLRISLTMLISVDDSNNETEKKAMKENSSWFSRALKKVDDFLTSDKTFFNRILKGGNTAGQEFKTASIFAMAGIIAREVPVIGEIMRGYGGMKLGELLASVYSRSKNKFVSVKEIREAQVGLKKIASEDIDSKSRDGAENADLESLPGMKQGTEQYDRGIKGIPGSRALINRARAQLLDPSFRKNFPDEYNRLRGVIDKIEQDEIIKVAEKNRVTPAGGVERLTITSGGIHNYSRERAEAIKAELNKRLGKEKNKTVAAHLGRFVGMAAGVFSDDLVRGLVDMLEHKGTVGAGAAAPAEAAAPETTVAETPTSPTPSPIQTAEQPTSAPTEIPKPEAVETPAAVSAAEADQPVAGAVTRGVEEQPSVPENAGVKIHREFWYDNDKPESFELNEKLLRLGGVRGSGFDKEGNIVFDISKMTADGSYHGEQPINVPELLRDADADGHAKKLMMLITLDDAHQNEVIEAPIDKDGKIIIDGKSDLAQKLFERDKNNQLVFKGKLLEVVELGDKAQDGTQNVRVIATSVGQGNLDKEAAAELLKPNAPAAAGAISQAESPVKVESVERAVAEPAPVERGIKEPKGEKVISPEQPLSAGIEPKIVNDIVVEPHDVYVAGKDNWNNTEIKEITGFESKYGAHLLEVATTQTDGSNEHSYILVGKDENNQAYPITAVKAEHPEQALQQALSSEKAMDTLAKDFKDSGKQFFDNPYQFMHEAGLDPVNKSEDTRALAFFVDKGITDANQANFILQMRNNYQLELKDIFKYLDVTKQLKPNEQEGLIALMNGKTEDSVRGAIFADNTFKGREDMMMKIQMRRQPDYALLALGDNEVKITDDGRLLVNEEKKTLTQKNFVEALHSLLEKKEAV